ncbi:MAG: C-GCAxxG-C-C family protein [Thermodesulfobacteriota bacterium]
MSLEEVARRIELADYSNRKVEPGSREKLLDRVAWAAYYNDRVYEGCTRSVLYALQSHLHLGDGQALRASTALAAGVARMGETCGAVTGGIMGIGLILGREDLADIKAYRDSMQASYEMYGRFKEELGSTLCFEIQKGVLGRSFDFKKDDEAEQWYKSGGLEICPMVCAIAARIAGDIILTLQAKGSAGPAFAE